MTSNLSDSPSSPAQCELSKPAFQHFRFLPSNTVPTMMLISPTSYLSHTQLSLQSRLPALSQPPNFSWALAPPGLMSCSFCVLTPEQICQTLLHSKSSDLPPTQLWGLTWIPCPPSPPFLFVSHVHRCFHLTSRPTSQHHSHLGPVPFHSSLGPCPTS